MLHLRICRHASPGNMIGLKLAFRNMQFFGRVRFANFVSVNKMNQLQEYDAEFAGLERDLM